MSEKTRCFGYVIILTTFFIIFLELVGSLSFSFLVKKGEIPFKQNELIYQLANKSKDKFLSAEKKGTEHQLFKICSMMFYLSLYFIASVVVLSKNAQKQTSKMVNHLYSPVKNNFRELKPTEINLVTTLVTYLAFSNLVYDIIFKRTSWVTVAFKSALYLIGYFYLFPLIIFGINILFEKFGGKVIVAAYLTWFIITILQFSSLDDVDTASMDRMDIDQFDIVIQEQLKRFNLEDSVYIEKKAGKETNAALVGYGRRRRIEISGGLTSEDTKSLDSVLLHEIGHAYDHSLIKKMAVYLLIIFVEMTIVFLLYSKVSRKFRSTGLSQFSAFLLLYIVFRLFLRPYLFMVFKMTSQLCEINADKFAEKYGHGEELGKTLYKIVVDGNEYIKPTPLYTLFTSTHPPIGKRINSLKDKS